MRDRLGQPAQKPLVEMDFGGHGFALRRQGRIAGAAGERPAQCGARLRFDRIEPGGTRKRRSSPLALTDFISHAQRKFAVAPETRAKPVMLAIVN